MLLEIILSLTVLIFLIYRWATINNDFFKKRGIPFEKPTLFLGNTGDTILRRKNFFHLQLDLYQTNNAKISGFFDQRKPMIMIKDPEIIKAITIKHFDHFVNHDSFTDDERDLFSNSLFLMKDSKWKDMRSTLTPIFTGSKLRQMFPLINEVAQNTVKFLQQEAKTSQNQALDVDVKDCATRFTNDAIASAVFGLQVNSFEDKKNEFYLMGKKVTNFTTLQTIKFFLYNDFKTIMKYLNITLFDQKDTDYFMHLVLDAMKYRKDHNIHRPDMIQMLMEAHGSAEQTKTHNREWSDIEIVAQFFLFFFAGFDTTASLSCFVLHELMENPEVQQTLLEEIHAVEEELNGAAINYETIMGMKYLDMIISETLRRWPPTGITDRICNKDFVYKNDEFRFEFKAGDTIWLPISGLHYDTQYFKDPQKFDPERFSEENKANIQPFTYFPFGLGPRICIGNRFALLESKALLYYIVLNFRIEACDKTTTPMKLSPKSFQMEPENGFWLKFIPRG